MQTPRTEFAQALKAIATERGLDPVVIIATIKEAIEAAYERDARDMGVEVDEFLYEVVIDPINGETKIFAYPPEKPEEKKDVTPPGFGRIAAQTAKQVIHQKIREAEKGAIMDEFSGRIGTLISGMILRFDGPNVRVDIGRTVEAIMPAEERVPSERLNLNQRLTFLLKEIRDDERGKQIILSRADGVFVEKLFAREVPEISSGSVVVKAIARDAGVRTKIAVASNQAGVDPVGSCVGQKGVRVQAVTNELGGERVDIVSWTEKDEDLIKAALSPVEVLALKLDKKEKTAVVKVPEDQLSMAIGKDGQNVRLAGKLSGYRIDVEGDPSVITKKEEVVAEKVEEKVEEVEEVKEDKDEVVPTPETVTEEKVEVEEEKAEEKEESPTEEPVEAEASQEEVVESKEENSEESQSDSEQPK
jgi:N utilization substance protein A